VDAAASLGAAVIARIVVAAALTLAIAGRASADNYALVVAGASGGPAYAEKYNGWRTSMVTTLTAKFGYPDDRVVSIGEASRDQVLQAFAKLRTRLTKDDILVVMLIGHGTDEKFNLVGPDMPASEWAAQLKPIPARIVFVDMASSSFPFLGRLSAPGRIVITAAESAAQQFETVFPEFFVKAFSEGAADTDKDGRVSMLEAFTYASANVHAWFDQHNQLPTERAVLAGKTEARATFLQPRAASGDPKARRRAELETAIADLRAKRSSMTPAAYDAELERLLVELARVSRP
jgi:hypothetical protein